jgi:hypothetical protein
LFTKGHNGQACDISRVVSRCLGILLTVTVLSGCGDGSDGNRGADNISPPPPPPLSDVVLEETAGVVGSTVPLSGLDIDSCPLVTAQFKVGGEEAAAVLGPTGNVHVWLPLFYDEAAQWPAPPSEPQDVEIYCDGSLFAHLPRSVTLTELTPAPGTTEALITDWKEIVSEYQGIFAVLIPEPGPQQQLLYALFGAVKSFFDDDNPDSLPAMLQTLKLDDPQQLALLDALYAAWGVNEKAATFRRQLEDMRAQAVVSSASAIAAPKTRGYARIQEEQVPQPAAASSAFIYEITEAFSVTDVTLSEQMQAENSLRKFGKDVIHSTSEEFGGPASVVSAISRKFKLAEAIDQTLSSLDFILNKIVVSLLPARMDLIKLEVAITELQNSEVTYSIMTLYASNQPIPMTITDVTSAVLSTMGVFAKDLPAPPDAWLVSVEEAVRKIWLVVFDLISQKLQEYSGKSSLPFDFDMEVVSLVPLMHFEAKGKTRELYTLYPRESDVIEPLSDKLEWQADEENWGSESLYVTGKDLLFGETGQTGSENVPVTVGGLTLVLSQHLIDVPEGGENTVSVKLSNPPREDEVIVVSADRESGDSDISITSGSSMTFDDTNWDREQYIDLYAAEDEGNENGEAIFRVWTEIDGLREGGGKITIEDKFTATEVDELYLVSDKNALSIPEDETAEFGIKLNQEPSSTITATVVHFKGDPDISIESSDALKFTETNWDRYQTVTLYAAPDEDNENGSATFHISADQTDVGGATVTATEDEEGVASNTLYIKGAKEILSTLWVRTDWEGEVPINVLDPENSPSDVEGSGRLSFSMEPYTLQLGSGDFTKTCTYSEVGFIDVEITGTREVYTGVPPRYLLNAIYMKDTIETVICDDDSGWSEQQTGFFNDGQRGMTFEEPTNYIDEHDYVEDYRIIRYYTELLDKTNL